MMKPRTGRAISEQTVRNKSESLTNGPAAVQSRAQVQLMNTNAQTAAQAIRKRRSSINVYDQPSSLNSRLRQLETDMLRLDEDRTKLFDDTHSALAQYELRLNEIHAILKSRQDNVDKYVEDMRLLLQAKEDFEKQAKMLHEKHDRVHEKFMHRETTISREIKLLKNKFELLEKNRQFRSLMQKSGCITDNGNTTDDPGSEAPETAGKQRGEATVSEGNSSESLEDNRNAASRPGGPGVGSSGRRLPGLAAKSVRIKLSKLNPFYRFMDPVLGFAGVGSKLRRKSNRISSISGRTDGEPGGDEGGPTTMTTTTDKSEGGGGGGGGGGDTNSKQKKGRRKANLLCRLFR